MKKEIILRLNDEEYQDFLKQEEEIKELRKRTEELQTMGKELYENLNALKQESPIRISIMYDKKSCAIVKTVESQIDDMLPQHVHKALQEIIKADTEILRDNIRFKNVPDWVVKFFNYFK